MTDTLTSKAHEIGNLDRIAPRIRLAAKLVRSELRCLPHQGRGARGRFTDAAVARISRVTIRTLGEAVSVGLGLATWTPVEGAVIEGLGGNPDDFEATPTDLGRTLATLIAAEEVPRG